MAWAGLKPGKATAAPSQGSPGDDAEVLLRCGDGEEFSVSMRVARQIGTINARLPTTEVLDVDIADCQLLDHILRFLECQLAAGAAKQEDEAHLEIDVLQLPEYAAAAYRLKIPSLAEHCKRVAARFKQPRVIRWDEVLLHQKADDCWLLIDRRVYDVTKWLPLHPGGRALLLGLGKDASYLFEIYHASNDAYTYLNNYFVGVLDPQDAEKVPKGATPASEAFLDKLRSLLAR